MLYLRFWRYFAAALVSGGLLVPALSFAAGAISQSYTTDATITPGTILSLVSKGSSAVQPATNTGTITGLVGVAVSQPVLQLSTNNQHSIQVAVGGTAQTLVSDINGTLEAGDKITASPITGVGMKALTSGEIIGTAQASLGSVSTTTRTVTDHNGKNTTVKVGLIPVAVTAEYYSAASQNSLSAFVPSFLQDLANAISGKPVSPVRVLLSLVILLLGSITVIVMLNAAIRNGIISIGRNPLAGPALRKGLIDVILAALGVLLITGVVVYAVLAS